MTVVNRVPDVVFKTRVRDESVAGDNPYRWEDKSTADLFGGKKVVVFSLPGAFTPDISQFESLVDSGWIVVAPFRRCTTENRSCGGTWPEGSLSTPGPDASPDRLMRLPMPHPGFAARRLL